MCRAKKLDGPGVPFMRTTGPCEQQQDKPVSRILSPPVKEDGDHSSRRRIAAPLQQPTRRFDAPGRHVHTTCVVIFLPIWSCSVWGLPCHLPYGRRGALLPHLFTLTEPVSRQGGMFSVALAVFQPLR